MGIGHGNSDDDTELPAHVDGDRVVAVADGASRVHAPGLVAVCCRRSCAWAERERLEADDAATIAHGPQVRAELPGVGADVEDEIDPEALQPLLELEHRVHLGDQPMQVVAARWNSFRTYVFTGTTRRPRRNRRSRSGRLPVRRRAPTPVPGPRVRVTHQHQQHAKKGTGHGRQGQHQRAHGPARHLGIAARSITRKENSRSPRASIAFWISLSISRLTDCCTTTRDVASSSWRRNARLVSASRSARLAHCDR